MQQLQQFQFKKYMQLQVLSLLHKSKPPLLRQVIITIYVAWWSNKTGNDEVMFKASTDGGKTFGDKMNLSNTPNSDSQDAQIAAAGSNVMLAGG
jgi:hypothetical protein